MIVWPELEDGLCDAYEMLPEFLASTVAIGVVSLWGASPEKVGRFFGE